MPDDDPTKPDLSLVEMDWLLTEVKRRTVAFIAAWEMPDKTRSDAYRTFIDQFGSPNTCLGLAVRAEREVLDDMAKGRQPDESE